jgi:uncharacterized membrane protein YccC
MATPARSSIPAGSAEAREAPLDRSLGFRLPAWLDPVSAQIAIKTAVGVVIAQAVALWLDWSPTGATLAVLMLQSPFFGRTLARSLLRMLGALLGSIVGLFVLHLFVQERALLILAVALLMGFVIYMQLGSRHPYAWLFFGFSLALLTFGNASNPEAAYDAAVAWVSGNAVGITVVLVMQGVLWPQTSARNFEHLVHAALRDGARLFAEKVAGFVDGRMASEEIARLEGKLIGAMPQLRLALHIAGYEPGRLARHRPDYELLIVEVQSLTSLIITFGESLKFCGQSAAVTSTIRQSVALRDLIRTLNAQLDHLVTDLDRGRRGTGLAPRDDVATRIRVLTDRLFADLRSREHTALDMAVLAAAMAKALEMTSRIAELRRTFQLLAEPHGPALAQKSQQVLGRPPSFLGPTSDRWRKAAAASFALAAGALLWITTNWPAPGKLLLFAFMPTGLGALLPQLPTRGALQSLIYGPALAAILYFGIMPGLAGMWELAPFLILALFPCAYFANSANPTTSIAGMFSAIWLLELINLSEGQIYLFSSFIETLIGIVGGVVLGVVAISLLDAPIPERRFRNHVREFFAVCERTVHEMVTSVPGDPAALARLTPNRARLFEQQRKCQMWLQQLDHERFSDDERAKAAWLIAAMRALAFRQDALERARLEFADAAALPQLAAARAELRARAASAFAVLRRSAARFEPAPPILGLAALAGPYEAWLEALRSVGDVDGGSNELGRRVLVLMGLHQALAYAIHDCHERFNALDWPLWGTSRF